MLPKLFPDDGVLFDMSPAVTMDFDAELMARVKSGDDDSFRLLLDRHRQPIVQFISRMVRNQAVAEELAQEVFLRVYRSRETYAPTAKFTTWLFRLATNVTLNWLRDHRPERSEAPLDSAIDGRPTLDPADQSRSIEQDLVRESRQREIREAIAALPEKQRAAVLMHKYDELGYGQIAKVLGCTDSAVKSLLFRAYESLRSRLAHFNGRSL
jgi:RNA polymerase sigma-70 factor (ECF subfamily)